MRAVVVCVAVSAISALALVAAPGCSSFTADGDDEEEEEEEEEETSCDGDRDCRGGERCVDAVCRAICDDADRACPDGEQCINGACIPDDEQVCEPGAIGCVDDGTAFVCNADGSERTEAPCREDQICIEGVCRAQVCEPSTTSCNGSALVTCSADGTERTVTACDDVCEGDLGFGCGCTENACAARTCEPGSARCVGNSAQACDELGFGFGELVDCGAEGCYAGLCLPDNCTPGDSLCSGRTLLECDDDGVGYNETSCDQACDTENGVATCTERVCTPLEASCVDDDTVTQCNAQGTEEVTISCGSRRFCENGTCQDEVCDPNSRTCVGDSVVACDARGANETVTPCGDSATCQNGQCIDDACVPQCGARECGPDPQCGLSCGDCSGTCSADGQCTLATGSVMTVEVSWTPATSDVDLYVSRNVDAAMCNADTCYFATCQQNDPRPDWDNSGGISDGDPILDVVNVETDNPEDARVPLPLDPQGYRVGAHVFSPSTGSTTTVATIRIRVDGALVSTHSRPITPDTLWEGVIVSWNGSELSSNDDGTVVTAFECGDNPPNGDTCTSDEQCQEGFACDEQDFFGGGSGQCIVGCRTSADCGATQECNADHDCVLASSVVGWKAACENDAQCEVGFHCDFLTQRCEEACTPGCSPGTDCCELSGGSQCTPDPFFQVFGNCDP